MSRGGVPKHATPEAEVTADGVAGDRQRDRRFHGGPDRAVTLFSVELIAALRAEGHSIDTGTTGENLTVADLDWARMVPGARVDVGPVRLEITRYAPPCHNIAGSFVAGDIERVAQKVHPGWSRVCARVIAPGRIRVGDPVVVRDGPRPPA